MKKAVENFNLSSVLSNLYFSLNRGKQFSIIQLSNNMNIFE